MEQEDTNQHKLLEELKDIYRKIDILLGKNSLEQVLPNKEISRTLLSNSNTTTHFSSIDIENYKQFQNFSIPNLNRINLIGGDNNSGKSSLLEAIYLLCIQNDIFAFVEMQRKRGKFFTTIPSNWLFQNLPKKAKVKGVFFGVEVDNSFFVHQEEDKSFDKTNYFSTLFLKANFDNEYSESKMRLFEKDKQSYFKHINNLCNVRYSSPFSRLIASNFKGFEYF